MVGVGNNSSDMPVVTMIDFHMIDWPEGYLNDPVRFEVLRWLVSDLLGDQILDLCRRGRIHVVPKPKSRNQRYLVVGGLQEFLCLLSSARCEKAVVVLWPQLSGDEARAWFIRDLQRMLFGFQAGPTALAARAALLVDLSLERDFGIKAPPGLLKKRNHNLLKEITGFDRRSYMRASKDEVPDSVLRWVDSMLGLSASQDGEFKHHGT